MAYNQKQLDAYRQLIAEGKPFKSLTCPYCTGQRDATVKHIHPSTKPADAWAFWHDVLIRKYAAVQSASARHNMNATATADAEFRAQESGGNAVKVEEGEGKTSAGPRMFVVGPMVDQSELPFRMLCRQYGSTLAYTPMLHARSFAEGATYREHFLTTTPVEEVKAAMENASFVPSPTELNKCNTADDGGNACGGETELADTRLVDRPCIVQFCGHDADTVLAAARYAVLGEGTNSTTNNSSSSNSGSAPKKDSSHPAYPVRVHVKNTTTNTNDSSLCADQARSSAASGENEKKSIKAESEVEEHLLFNCDAVDLNLGCPQGIARRGHYGSFLMEDWELIHTIIHTLHVELEVPVTVKIRVFDHPGQHDVGTASTSVKDDFDEALTILYARMIRDAGAQVLCVHGRTRDMKGQLTSVANMELIRRVRAALNGSIPVISNGNVYTYDDVIRNLRDTQCEGHMCAEPLLWDPALFSHPSHPVMPGRTHGADKATRLAALHTALVYVSWVRRCPVDIGFVKAHLFKMCFHSYELHTEFRDVLGQLKTNASAVKMVEYNEDEREREGAEGERKLKDENVGGAAVDEVSSAVTSASAFEQYVDAIEGHLRQLMDAEQRCAVEGEQPKAAREEKAKAREEVVDVWEAEDGLGIDF